jgi:hypothetical protein
LAEGIGGKANLDLAVIGNSTIAALIDPRGRHCGGVFPRLDNDPSFARCSAARRRDRIHGRDARRRRTAAKLHRNTAALAAS